MHLAPWFLHCFGSLFAIISLWAGPAGCSPKGQAQTENKASSGYCTAEDCAPQASKDQPRLKLSSLGEAAKKAGLKIRMDQTSAEVTVSGTVPSNDTRDIIIQIILLIPGVEVVVNELIVDVVSQSEPPPPERDQLIGAAIQTLILDDPHLKDDSFSFLVQDGGVVVSGPPNAESLLRAILFALQAKGVVSVQCRIVEEAPNANQ